MITVSDVASILGWNMVSGAPYLWQSYGPNARFMDFASDCGTWRISCVFHADTSRVVEISGICGKSASTPWTWVDPEFKDGHDAEARARGVNPNIAWDNVVFHFVGAEDLRQALTKTIGG